MRIQAVARALTVSLVLVLGLGQSAASAAPVCGQDVDPFDVSPAYIVQNCPEWIGDAPDEVLELVIDTAGGVLEEVQPFVDPALCVAALGLNVSVNGALNCGDLALPTLGDLIDEVYLLADEVTLVAQDGAFLVATQLDHRLYTVEYRLRWLGLNEAADLLQTHREAPSRTLYDVACLLGPSHSMC